MSKVIVMGMAWVLPAAWASGLLDHPAHEPRLVQPSLAASWEGLGRRVYVTRVAVGTAYRYVALGGMLPSGIRVDPASGELRGTPARVTDRTAGPSPWHPVGAGRG